MSPIRRYFDCLRLNLRALSLASRNRWLTPEHVARGYDALAEDYDAEWLSLLRDVTDALLARLPAKLGNGPILDLGCGTGYATAFLEEKFPGLPVIGVDVSAGMLAQAEKRCFNAKFRQADLLSFLREQPNDSTDLVLSAWAIGYSYPDKIFRECRRVLRNGGFLAFVVNRADTLAPIFRAFRVCMGRFPDKVALALWPRFPKSQAALERSLGRVKFQRVWMEDGRVEIIPKRDDEGAALPWLLKTGVLAGFDSVLPLAEDRAVAELFERTLREDNAPLCHRYVAYIGKARK